MPDRLLTLLTTGAGVDQPAAVDVPVAVTLSVAFSVSVAGFSAAGFLLSVTCPECAGVLRVRRLAGLGGGRSGDHSCAELLKADQRPDRGLDLTLDEVTPNHVVAEHIPERTQHHGLVEREVPLGDEP